MSVGYTLSVVIPSCGRLNDLDKLLKSISESKTLPDEVIIVVQNINDLNIYMPLNLHGKEKIINDYGGGASRARNIGWKNSSGQIVSFVDDDAVVDKEWLSNIVKTFKMVKLNPGVVSGKIIPVFNEINDNWEISERHRYILPSYDQGELIGPFMKGALPPSVNYSIMRTILEETGGFNEKLGVNSNKRCQIYGEDSDLSLRVKNLGYDLIYNPGVTVYHPVPLSRQCNDYVKKRMYIDGMTNAYIFRMNSDKMTVRTYLIIKTILKLIKNTLWRNDKQLSFELINYYRGHLFGLIWSKENMDR